MAGLANTRGDITKPGDKVEIIMGRQRGQNQKNEKMTFGRIFKVKIDKR